MKDEEMAEEYAEKYFGKKTELVEVWKLKSCKENFLAGLKAGRPQWHDLRKEPTDLPKEDMYEAVIITPSGEWEKGIFRRIDCKCYWRIVGFNENVKVIAWYEIPNFDKE